MTTPLRTLQRSAGTRQNDGYRVPVWSIDAGPPGVPQAERCAGHFDPARSTPTDHRMPILYGTLRVGAAGSVLASFMCLPRLMGKATAVAPVPISTRRGSPLRNRRRGWWYYHDRHPPADHLG
jgi:hypothetical protein